MDLGYRCVLLPDGLSGMRADAAICRLLGVSRSVAADVIAKEMVRCNDTCVRKSTILYAGDRIEIGTGTRPVCDLSDTTAEKSVNAGVAKYAKLGVLWQDEHIAVINKPAGVATHASPGWTEHTVTSLALQSGIILAHCGQEEREGIVHRLDAFTSGVLVVAKTNAAYAKMKNAFRNREVKKIYHALVQGFLKPSEGVINAPIERVSGSFRFGVGRDGRNAITHYKTLEEFRYGSAIEVNIKTGRTHQIRVHMSSIGHVCIGDSLYGCNSRLAKALGVKRQMLHARSIAFRHPCDGRDLYFESPLPEDFARALAILRTGVEI